MSYRPSVVDSSRAAPYFYQRGHYPIKTHKTHRMNLMTYPTGSRVIGGKNPAWVRALDYATPKIKWIRRNWWWLKYYGSTYALAYNALQKRKTKNRKSSSAKFQKSNKHSTSFRRSRRKQRNCYCNRRGFCRCRSNQRYRFKRSNRFYY